MQVDFDPAVITYSRILDIVWQSHNPCGKSWSRQYLSAIFYEGEEQKRLALESKAREQAKRGAIHTEVLPLKRFYVAEDYHQKYYLRQNTILMKEFASVFGSDAEFRDSTAAARLNGLAGGHGSRAQLKADSARWGLTPAACQRILEAVKVD